MTLKIISLTILVLLATYLCDGLSQTAKTNSLPEVANLFLGKWEGKGKNEDGQAYRSQLVFEWTLNKHFLTVDNAIETAGKREHYATTYYGWQPVMAQLVFWSFDKDGTINEGVAELEAMSLKHEWRSFSKGGEIRDWRSILRRIDQDNMTFSVLNGQNEEVFAIKYKRVR